MFNFFANSALAMTLHLGGKWFIDGFIGNVWFNLDELETSMTHKKWWNFFFFSVLMVP